MPGRSPGAGLANTPASPPDALSDTHPASTLADGLPPSDRIGTTRRKLDTDAFSPSWPVIVPAVTCQPLPTRAFTPSAPGPSP